MSKKVRKIMAGLLAVALVITAVAVSMPKEVSAQSGDIADEIQYLQVKNFSFSERENLIPEKEGYLFGGWYKQAGGLKEDVIETEESVADGSTVYAKMVPAYVLSLKAQNGLYGKNASKETTETFLTGSSPYADTRLVSSVDSMNYSEVGYTVYLKNSTKLEGLSTKKVYTSIIAGENTYTPSNVFGSESSYFVVWVLKNIPQLQYSSIIYARPYWKTMDGTKVEGLGKYVHVDDDARVNGQKNVINVPINICKNIGVAAGEITVDYDKTKLNFEGFEGSGRLFSEMRVHDNNGTIKCVGNISSIAANVSADTDIFVNLRFTYKGSGEAVGSGNFLTFTTGNAKFCDKDENFVNGLGKYIWSIRY